jgi:hypothetical protein
MPAKDCRVYRNRVTDVMTRLFLMIALAALGIGSVVASTRDSVAASSAICAKLQRQLASLSSGRSRSSSRSPEVRQLQAELANARGWARQEGCLRGLFRQPSYSPQCISITSNMARLQAEISQAKQAARYQPAGSSEERRRVLATLAAYDCDAVPQHSIGLFTRLRQRQQAREEVYYPDTAYAPATTRRTRNDAALRLKREREQERARARETRAREIARNAREMRAKERERDWDRTPEPKWERQRDQEREWERASARQRVERVEKVAATNEGVPPIRTYNVKGGLRTLCVRTCDGYYFPISFSTDKKFFARDEQSCSAMCPGTEVKLYYHNVKDEDSENMVSADTNTPYTELPTAFNYRKLKATPGCSCQAAARQSQPVTGTPDLIKNQSTPEDAKPGEGDKGAAAGKASYIGVPRTRPDPAADPETMLNTEGGLNKDDLIRLTEKDPGAITSSSGARVRVVGPTFFPDQQEAKGLRVPGRTRDR